VPPANKLKSILTHVREGLTLKEICAKKGFPSRLTVYDWLRDPEMTYEGQPFKLAYKMACQDRALTWHDDLATSYDGIDPTDTDNAQLRFLSDRAKLRLQIAKDQVTALNVVAPTGSGDQNIRVTITRFNATDEELS